MVLIYGCQGRVPMNLAAVVGLFLLGFFVMAAGGIAGGAVHQTPSFAASAFGCLISTVGLGVSLCGMIIAKSKLAMRFAEVLAGLAILYGFFHSFTNIILQSESAPTLIYGVYMSLASIAAALVLSRAHIWSSARLAGLQRQ